MIRLGTSALAAAVLLAYAAPASAACTKDSDCAIGKVCSTGKCVTKKSTSASTNSAAAPSTVPDSSSGDTIASHAGYPGLAWGGIGIYTLSVTVNTAFGSFSGSSTNFGINAGAAYNVLALSADVPLAVFGNLAIDLASGGNAYPLTGGAAVRYDKLPVHLLGGAGLTIMPVSGGGNTGIGVGLLAMGSYPIPSVDRLSIQAQLQYHFMNNGYGLFVLNGGVGYAF